MISSKFTLHIQFRSSARVAVRVYCARYDFITSGSASMITLCAQENRLFELLIMWKLISLGFIGISPLGFLVVLCSSVCKPKNSVANATSIAFANIYPTKIQLKRIISREIAFVYEMLTVTAEDQQTLLKIPVCRENSPTNMFTSPSMKFFSSYTYFFCVSACSALIQRMWKISAENGTQYDWKNCKQVQGSSNNNPDLGKYQNQYEVDNSPNLSTFGNSTTTALDLFKLFSRTPSFFTVKY